MLMSWETNRYRHLYIIIFLNVVWNIVPFFHANSNTPGSEFNRKFAQLVTGLEEDDTKVNFSLIEEAVTAANRDEDISNKGIYGENNDLLNLNKLLTTASYIAANNDKYKLSAVYAKEAIEVLKNKNDMTSRIIIYASLLHLLMIQWTIDDANEAKITAERMYHLGFDAVVNSSVSVFTNSDLPKDTSKQGEEGRLYTRKLSELSKNYMIAALVSSPVSGNTLAETVVLRKGIISEIEGSVFTASQLPEAHLSPAMRREKHRQAELWQLMRDNAEETSALAYASKVDKQNNLPRPIELQRQRTELEREILTYGAINKYNTTLSDIEGAIPDGYLVVEYVQFAIPGTLSRQESPVRYLAIALNHAGLVGISDIGTSADVDAKIYAACRAIVNQFDAGHECPNTTAQTGATVSSPNLDSIAAALYNSLLGPFDKDVSAASHVIISPDGAMNFLPFEMLVAKNKRLLVMDHIVSYVDSARELLRWGQSVPSAGPPVIIGAPEFTGKDNDSVELCAKSRAQTEPLKRQHPLRTMTMNLQFPPLCWSLQEVEGVRKSLPGAVVLTGLHATADAVRHLQAPRILHLSTHGFAAGDLRWPDDWRKSVPWNPADFGVLRTDPMVLGGLALAGASLRAGPGGHDDGILSAGDVRFLRLSGTQLVVLSACDSGLGFALGGEGVIGLRSAFREAGARAVTFALWPTADDLTVEFMTRYYSLMKEGFGNAEALARVKRAYIEQGGDQALPWAWAQFVAYGYPGPVAP